MTLKVEGRPELERDEYSKGISNVDNDAYKKYMRAAIARKQRNTSLEKNTEDINNLLLAGADKVSINTAAVRNENLIKESAQKFGSQCIVVAVDAKKVNNDKWEVFTHGGRKPTGKDVLKFVEKMESLGAGEILLTSMDRDGTKKGYDLDLTKKVSNLINIPVIASGGVGNLEHLHQGFKIGKASAVLAASIFHFGEYSILDAKQYLDSKGIPVRI